MVVTQSPSSNAPTQTPDVLERARRVQLLAMDVDGVLTNGEIAYTSSGEEIKVFNVKDGLGITLAKRAGLKTAIITARQSPMVARRAEELGIDHLYQLAKNKLNPLFELTESLGLSLDEVAYVGDDLPDIPALEAVGLACCPADAVTKVQSLCHLITRREGGKGAIREIVDLILQAKTPAEGSSL